MAKTQFVNIPWQSMPPQRVNAFDKSNKFGRHCICAIIPGWTELYGDATTTIGSVRSVGQEFLLNVDERGTASPTLDTVVDTYAHLGPCRAARFGPATATGYCSLFRSNTSDSGVRFPHPENLTVIALCRPEGDGRVSGVGDPRIFSQDEGTEEIDHDLMLGIVNSGNNARCRIRLGSSTHTVIPTGGIQDDALNLIAGGVYSDTGTSGQRRGWCALLREDGIFSDTEESNTNNTYNPRTTTDMALGGSAGADDNAFNGDIIGVWLFDTSFYGQRDLADVLTDFMANPWQVFAPQQVPVYFGGPTSSVNITDVNTTESWTDGDAGLVITGTGFV